MNWLEWLLEPRKAEAGVIIPNAFKSRVISEVAKRIGGYPKTATGRSILEALESKGAIPSGVADFYLRGIDVPGSELVRTLEQRWLHPRIATLPTGSLAETMSAEPAMVFEVGPLGDVFSRLTDKTGLLDRLRASTVPMQGSLFYHKLLPAEHRTNFRTALDDLINVNNAERGLIDEKVLTFNELSGQLGGPKILKNPRGFYTIGDVETPLTGEALKSFPAVSQNKALRESLKDIVDSIKDVNKRFSEGFKKLMKEFTGSTSPRLPVTKEWFDDTFGGALQGPWPKMEEDQMLPFVGDYFEALVLPRQGFYESLRLTPPPSHYNVGELMHFRGYVHPSRTAILNEIQSDYAQGWSKYRDVPAPPELTRWYIPAGESVLRWAADMPFSRVLIPERAAQESTRYGAKLPFYDDIIDYLSKRSAELGAPTRMEPIGGYLEPSLSKYYNYRGFLIELPESVKDAIRRTAKFGLAPLSLLPVYDEFRH